MSARASSDWTATSGWRRCPDWLLDEIRAGIESSLLTQYPALDGLYQDLSGMLALPRERLLLTAGSDAAFRALHQVYVRPGDRVAMLDPSYAMYPIYARMFGATPVQVPFASDLSLDAEQLLDAIGTGVRMVLLADPNQPTGTQLPREVLRAVLARAAEHGALVVVDEAYFPFSRTTVLPWLARVPPAGRHADLLQGMGAGRAAGRHRRGPPGGDREPVQGPLGLRRQRGGRAVRAHAARPPRGRRGVRRRGRRRPAHAD